MSDYKLFRTLHDVGMIYLLARLAVFLKGYGFNLGVAICIGVAMWFALAWLLHIGLEDDPHVEIEMDAFCRHVLGVLFLIACAFSVYNGLYILCIFAVVGAVGAFGMGWIGKGYAHIISRKRQ